MDWREVRYDAIVIGSGAAGGMAAKTLTDGGASVLLLEAGPELPAEDCRPRQRSRQEFESIKARQSVQSQNLWYNKENCHLFVDDLENPYSTEPSTQFNWIRSRQAGGRTLVWSRIALRLFEEDLKSGAGDGVGEPWPIGYQDLAPYYDTVEELVGVQSRIKSPPCVPDGRFLPGQAPESDAAPASVARNAVAKPRGIPAPEVVDDTNRSASAPPSHSSLGSTLLQCNQQKLTFRSNCVAARIVLDGPERARGVAFIDRLTGQWHEVSARTIILCASTIESIRLLLASATRDHPGGLGNSSGTLGHYLLDHFGGTRMVALGKLKDVESSGTERLYVPRFCNRGRQDEDFVRGYGIQGELQVRTRGTAILSLGVFGEVLPYFENSVQLDETIKDVLGLSVPMISFRYRENEHRMAQHAALAVREIVDSIGFQPVTVQDSVLPPGTRAHELGGVRMGASRITSVLNAFNQCWDVGNLFVTDGSCFPSASYKGPTLTIMALTRRACEHILRELRAERL
jgi:choline dehydrogenase-like flavoprotein